MKYDLRVSKINSCTQGENESVDEFILLLVSIALQKAGYETSHNELVWDIIVVGISDGKPEEDSRSQKVKIEL